MKALVIYFHGIAIQPKMWIESGYTRLRNAIVLICIACATAGYSQSMVTDIVPSASVVAYSYQAIPAPIVSLNPEINGQGYTFQWESSALPLSGFTAIAGATGAQLSFSAPLANTTFFRRIAVKSGVTTISNTVRYEVVSTQWEDLNYIRVHEVLTPGQTAWQQVDQLPIGDKLVRTTYLDGLGRSVQTVDRETATPAEGTSTWGDLVQHFAYDAFGRPTKQYLPYTTNEHAGKLKPDAENKQGLYYTANYQDAKPYSTTEYDGSPLHRNKRLLKPGNDWHNSTGLQSAMWLNTNTDDVQMFIIGPAEGDMPLQMGIYAANTLLKYVHTDELGKQVIEYVNGLGQLVLKKVQLTAAIDAGTGSQYAGWICTYYVYDDFGNLRVEISPQAVDWLRANAWSFATATGITFFTNLCFAFAYDEKGRMVYKKSPEVQPLYMLYDKRDRIVLMQDGNQRAKSPKEWTLNLYDDLDRLTHTVLYKTNITREALRNNINNSILTQPGHLSPIDITTFNNTSVCTILKEIFYDHYTYPNAFYTAHTFNTVEATQTEALPSPPHALPVQKTNRTLGMVTGTVARILSSSQNLLTTHYYDEYGSGIQTIETNIKGGADIYTKRFHWDGRLLASRELRNIPGANITNFAIETRYAFDALRRVTHTYKKWAGSAEKLVSTVQYDAFGRVGTKRLSPDFNGHFAGIGPVGGGLEALQYSYNIQGTLVGINKPFALKEAGYNRWGNFFGMYFGYTGDPTGVFGNTARLNGQLRGLVWNTQGDDSQRKYEYAYDNAGRLTAANFTDKPMPATTWANTSLNFSTTNLAYTLNGNLTALRNMGVQIGSPTPVLIDQLAYTYNTSGRSNRLKSVADNTTATTVNGTQGDFKKGPLAITATDYAYDANGNTITDLNKGMVNATGANTAGILYNHLDKPVEVNLDGKGRVKFTYDANGSRLKREFISIDATKGTRVTWYFGSLELEEVVGGAQPKALELKNIYFEEGRIRVITPLPSFSLGGDAFSQSGNINLPQLGSGRNTKQGSIDFFITDHRSDVRMILTEETQWSYTTASMETAMGRDGVEANLFGTEVQASRVPKTTAPGWTANVSENITRLSKSTQKIGPNQLLKVMGGDLISGTVQYYYPAPVTNAAGSTIVTDVVAILGNIIGTSSAVSAAAKAAAVPIATNAGSNAAFTSLLTTNASSPVGDNPKAYLNVIFFDERFNFVSESSQFARVQTAGNGAAPLALLNIKVPKNGYCLVYISNESDEAVFFDDMQVRHDRGRILEENHYYAYGLKIAALSSKAFGASPNNYQYQGDYSEFDDDLGWNDFALRSYDPQIGRFLQNDPYDQFASGYVGMGNDPGNGVDPSGGYFLGADNLLSGVLGGAVLGGIVGGAISGFSGGDFWSGATIGFGVGAFVGLAGGIDLSNFGSIEISGNFFQKLSIAKNLALASVFSTSAREMIKDLKSRPRKVSIKYGHKRFTRSASISFNNLANAGKKGTSWNDVMGEHPPVIGTGEGSGSSITLAQKPDRKPKDIKGRNSGSKTISLLHELFHAWEASYGKLDFDMVDGVRNMERTAVDWENVFRTELGKTPRKEYESLTGEMIDVYNVDFKFRAKKTIPKND